MSQPCRSLGKRERITCTECGHVCCEMVWPRGRDNLCHNCVEAYDRRASNHQANDFQPRRSSKLPPPGTALRARYKGADYEAMITAAGVEYGGRVYRTLSAAASAITLGPVSGPRFWGVATT